MLLIIYIFIGLSVPLFTAGVLGSLGRTEAVHLRLSSSPGSRRGFPGAALMHTLLGHLSPLTQNILVKLKLETKLSQKLKAGHLRFSPQEFLGIQLLLFLFLASGISFAFGRINPWSVLGGIVLAEVLPELWIRKRISGRRQSIARILPETVDLLSLCVEAGLDFTSSVKWIVKKAPENPMVEELAFVVEEINWGKPRGQALKDMAKRLNVPGVTSFTQALVQAERLGAPVNEAFTILSEDIRNQRFHQGERLAMKAPMKILIPLIFCILPVIGIIIGGPILLQFTSGGMLKGF